MVIGLSGMQLHPIEREIVSRLEAREEITIHALGGLDALSVAATDLGGSRFLPEIMGALVKDWKASSTQPSQEFEVPFASLLAGDTNDFTLIEVIDLLDANRPLPGRGDEICFGSFLSKAQDSTISPLTRGLAAEGCFRWAVASRRWQLRLLDFFLGVSAAEAPEFVRRLAKLAGVAHSHWHEQELLAKLEGFAECPEADAEASFELGMACLMRGVEADDASKAVKSFKLGKEWFQRSVARSEVNPEARLFLDCLILLEDFGAQADRQVFAAALQRISASAFELSAWFDSETLPGWLGARRLETVCWNQLAAALTGVLHHLDEASWWEPAAVIEQHVLAVYGANRAILKRSSDGSIDSLLRPTVVASVARQRGQAYQLKTWLQKNLSHEWAPEARHLLADVEQLVSRTGQFENPTSAAVEQPPIVALIDKRHFPEATRQLLIQVVNNALAVQLDNLTGSEIAIIEEAVGSARQHVDYQTNVHAQRLFDTVLVWTVRFLFTRLEMTKADDPTVAYLFVQPGGVLVTEDALQADFFRLLTTNASGSDLEPTNIGGGRADIRLKSSSERLVVEVKRELKDSSFDALAASYEGQTLDYQNVSIRLGFLLVLDLSNDPDMGTPHIRSLIQTRQMHRAGEDHPRLIVIVKVPGNRKRPSDLTKAAKTKKSFTAI
jgi:hypothetical protein